MVTSFGRISHIVFKTYSLRIVNGVSAILLIFLRGNKNEYRIKCQHIFIMF